MGNPNFQTGLFPHRVRPCAAMKSPSHSGRGSRPSCRTVLITAKQAIPLTIFDRSSMASSGSSIPAPHGVTSRNVTVPGRRSSGASTGGGRTALGAVSSPRCWTNWTTKGRSITTSGVSMAPSSGPARRRRGRKKTRAAPSNWGLGSSPGNTCPMGWDFLNCLFPPCWGGLSPQAPFHGGNRHGLSGYFVHLGHAM